MSHEERIGILRRHFERKGYRVHSGLQFGCELVLYADDPSKVHSDFCVHLVHPDGRLDWRTMQTLTRSMPDLHKTLILAHIVQNEQGDFSVEEMAIATEHAPFRHRKHNVTPKVGSQVKKPKTSSGGDVAKQKETNETSSAE
jgi:hypothetical protein